MFDRARRICTLDTLPDEFDLLRSTLVDNGYPRNFIDKHSAPRLPQPATFGPEKKVSYLFLPFCGDPFTTELQRRIRKATALAFPAAEPRIVWTTSRIPVRPLKDSSPFLDASNVIYEFTCGCGSSYLGRTERRLSKRISEHFPKWLLEGQKTGPRSTRPPSSAIARHALQCARFDRTRPPGDFFSIRARSRHPRLLPQLESTFILALKPVLCVQKEFVFTLALPWA